MSKVRRKNWPARYSPAFLTGLFFGVWLGGSAFLASEAGVQAAAIPKPALPVLTRAEQIRHLDPEQAKLGYSVRLRAVVTYCDFNNQDLYVQDATGGIYVDPREVKVALQVGQYVEVEGTAGAGDFSPEVTKPRITILGKAPLPRPQEITGEELESGSHDSESVEVEGRVRSVLNEGGRIHLSVASAGARFDAYVLGEKSPPKDLVGSKVRMGGVCSGIYNAKVQYVGATLLIPSLTYLHIVEKGPVDLFTIPARPIHFLLRSTPAGPFDQPVRVQGVVTLQRLGRSLYVHDGKEGIQVETREMTRLSVGDRVDVVGFPAVGEYSPILQEAVFRRLGTGQAPAPVQMTAAQMLEGVHDAELVRISGRLLKTTIQPGQASLVVEEGKRTFEAGVEDPKAGELASLRAGSLVQVTGICSIRTDANRTPLGFSLSLRTPEDIVVLQSPSWWTLKRALGVLGVMTGLVEVGLAWVMLLRRRVRKQTAAIREQLRREASLKEKYLALFENANDMVFTHDLEGHFTSLNKAGEEILGYTRQDATGLRFAELAAAEEGERLAVAMDRLRYGEVPPRGEWELLRKDGHRVVLEVNERLVTEDGKPVGVQGIARDITRRKRAERVQAAAYRIAELANSTHRLEDFYRSTHELVNTLMPAKNFYIALYDAAADVLSFSYYVDEQDEAPPPRRPRRGFTEYILRTGKPLLAPPEVFHELVKAGEIDPRGTQPVDRVGVPLRLNGEPVGVLVVQSYSGDTRYGEEEKNALQFISEQVAMAVSRKREEEERHFLQIVTQAIGTSEDVTSGLRATVQALCEVSGWVLGQVWVPSADGAHLEVTPAWYGNAPGAREFRSASEGLALLPGEGVPGRAWSTGQRVWLQEGLFDDDPARKLAASALGLKLGAAIPVLSEGKVLAVMEFFATKARAQDQGLLEVIASVGGQLGTLILRKRAEEALRESESKFRNLFAYSPLPMFLYDLETLQYLEVNEAAIEHYGYSREQFLKMRLEDLRPAEDVPQTIRDVRTLLTNQRWTGQARHLLKDGRVSDVEISALALDWKGRKAALAVARDITERKRTEEALQKAKEAAVAANRAKSEFLANMSHEIRTPMNGIIGMTELALDTPLTSEQRECLMMVEDSANALLTVVNDVLDFSKIEAGKLSLDLGEFNLHDVLANTLRSLSVRASQKGLELAWAAEAGVPECVIGDAGRIRQVIVNLAGNAIKFTEQGEVVVGVDVEARQGQEILLHFTVRDTGIGIAPEKQEAIFEAFTQADSSMTRKYGGTGLGLAISSRLVQMMDGRIWLESALGEGSTFHFTVRVGQTQAAEAKSPPKEVGSLSGLAVLVVDDNSTNRKILDGMLRRWSMRPEMAASAEEGLAALERSVSAGTPFPLVLLDAQMPGMDGFSLAERIKQNPKLASVITVMLTSAGQRGDAARCRELGIAVYLIKPIRQSELLEAMLAALGKPLGKEGATVITRHTLRENRRKLQVLLAEDNTVNQQLALRLLEKRGHRVRVASNGNEVLALLERVPIDEVDLVLMDIQMPGMDGLEATSLIREKEKASGRHIPIVAMTAHAMKGDRERCLAAGMDAYIAKPIEPSELFKVIESLVPSNAGATGGGPSESPEEVVLDEAGPLARAGGDPQLLRELVDLFLEECPRLMSKMRTALDQQDAKALERAAHTLKGSAGNFAAQDAVKAALELERIARSEELGGAALAYANLEHEISRLPPALARLGAATVRR